MACDDTFIQRHVENNLSKIELFLHRSNCSIGVISAESLIALEPCNIERLRNWALSIASNITIVCYVRKPTSYAASVIQERVKWGERLPLPASSLPVGRFKHQLPKWEAAFGRENMLVRSASREDLVERDVVADFATAIGYSGPLDRSTEYRNKGLSQAAVLILDALNALDNRLVSSSLAFQELWNMPGDKYRMPSDLARSVEVQAKPHLDYLHEHWGVQFSDISNTGAPVETFGKETAHSLAEFIAELHKQARSGEPSPFRERW